MGDLAKNLAGRDINTVMSQYLDPNIVQRGNILPFGRNKQGELELAAPDALLSVAKSLMLPGHVLRGGDWMPDDVTRMAGDLVGTSAAIPVVGKMMGHMKTPNAATLGMNMFHAGNKWPAEKGYPYGRMRLDKMGEGTGYQYDGWGAYKSKSPKLADEYRLAAGELDEAKFVINDPKLKPKNEAQERVLRDMAEVVNYNGSKAASSKAFRTDAPGSDIATVISKVIPWYLSAG